MKAKEINYQEKIQEYYKTLKNQVTNLDSHIDTVLQQHEQDFLNAFKCQMFNLYAQLKDLKKKNEESELKLKRDEQINQLQQSLQWFREEAVKLGESTQFYKKEAEKWKSKAESLEDDCKFLENQLKTTKRKIKLLQIEKQPERDSEGSLKTSIFKTQDLGAVRFIPSTKIGELISDTIQRSSYQLEEFLINLEKVFSELENKYNESIRHIKNCLDSEKKKNKSMSAHQNSVFLTKNSLENLFLECVEEVKKEVSKRKMQGLMNQRYKRMAIVCKEPKDGMIPSDKKKVLELLVSNEQVLTMLYEGLFPHRANTYGVKPLASDEKFPEIEELLKKVPTKPSTARSPFYSNKIKSLNSSI